MLKKYLPYFDLDLDAASLEDYLSQGVLMWGMAKNNLEDVKLYQEIKKLLANPKIDSLNVANLYFILDDVGFRQILSESVLRYEKSIQR